MLAIDWLLSNVLPFMVIITIIVFVHELGHYLVARWCGVHVEVFSIGFGPELFGFKDRAGTRWRFSAIPLGGYVKMFSDENEASKPDHKMLREMSAEDKKKSLFFKPVEQRIAVSAAGPLANFFLAILVMTALFTFQGRREVLDMPKVGAVITGSAAEAAGLQPGDVIVAVEGQKINTFGEMSAQMRQSPQKEIFLQILRGGETATFAITPRARSVVDPETGEATTIGMIGVEPATALIPLSLVSASLTATKDVYNVCAGTLAALGQMVTGRRSTDELSGPVGIAQIASKVATSDWYTIAWFVAFLSINLGLINLMPIPMLDGGHIVFYVVEMIRGKPLSERVQEYAFRIGFAVVIGLVFLSTFNDLSRLKIFTFFRG